MTGIKELLAAAEAEIDRISVSEARALLDDPEVTLVDVRDIRELQRDGKIPGAMHAPRGMLEFWIDPQSPYHKPAFAADKRFVFYCSKGWRSALAAQTAQRLGLRRVCDIEGGFSAWLEQQAPVEKMADKRPGR